MGSTETAGVVPLSHWTSVAGASGTSNNLVDSAGTATGASITWTSAGTWSTPTTETAGNARMYKGYLDTSGSGNTTTVTVSGLPAPFTGAPYTVYVYFDGDNGGAWRTGSYTIGTTTINGVDMGINFGGILARAVNAEGNYIAFTNVSGASFTLKGVGIDDIFRAPINGIQIVSTSTGAVAPGTYKLVNRLSGLSLDDAGFGGVGTGLVQWGYNAQTNQQWRLAQSGAFYTIQSVYNGLNASVNGSTTAGAKVVLETATTGNDQLWSVVKQADGYYTLVNRLSGLLMDDSGNSLNAGNPMVQWGANSGQNQEWSILAP